MTDRDQHDEMAATTVSAGARQALSFPFEDRAVRVEVLDDVPWFVLTDVCQLLAMKNPSQASARLDDDERRITKT